MQLDKIEDVLSENLGEGYRIVRDNDELSPIIEWVDWVNHRKMTRMKKLFGLKSILKMAQRKPLKKELRFVKSGMKMYYKNTLYAGKGGEIFNDNR